MDAKIEQNGDSEQYYLIFAPKFLILRKNIVTLQL